MRLWPLAALTLTAVYSPYYSSALAEDVAPLPPPPAEAADAAAPMQLISQPAEGESEVAPSPPSAAGEADLPVAPETTVVGRPGPFPAQPLPDTAAVTPTLTETPRSEIASSLTVITAEDLARTGQPRAAEVLRSVPGLDVVQQGTPGGVTSVFIRGANSAHTKVLLDGMPLNDPSNATRQFDFSQIDLENVERIEVLRGPQSTLYGSDAIGGVVNIITKRGEGPATSRATILGGSYGTHREGYNLSGGNERGYYSFGTSYLHTDGFSAADRRMGGVELDAYENATCSGRFGLTPSEDFDVDYVFRWVDQFAELDDFNFGAGPAVIDNLEKALLTEAFYNKIEARWQTVPEFWEQRLSFSYINIDRITTHPTPFVDVPRFLGQTRRIDYRHRLDLAEWNTAVAGVDYQHEDAVSQPDPFRDQYTRGAYFEDQIRLGENWFSTAGARWDDNSLAGSAGTYRVTSLYRLPGPKTAFHGSIGTGFRAPALAEQFFFFGNPDLRPERSFGWDVGVEQPLAQGRFVVDGTYFRNDFTDLVQFDFNTFTLRNIGRAYSSGTELTATWNIGPRTRLVGSYTYTFTRDLETDRELLRRAPHKASLAIQQRVWEDRAGVNLSCNYVSPRLDSSNIGLVTLEEYYLVNLAGTYQLTRHWELTGRIDNLLGETYQDVYGFGTAACSFYGGANARW